MARRALLALAFAAIVLPAGAADLGTLFYTAEERARLDRMRRGEPVNPPPAAVEAPPPAPPEVTGFVRRSDGRNTLWIDGRPVTTNNRRNDPLFDPRRVKDLDPPLPPTAIKVIPEPKTPR